MARVGEEEENNKNALNMIFPSLSAPYKHPITKEKKISEVALLPSASKGAKIDVPAGESSTTHHAVHFACCT